ncbi:hypothetical protein Q5752_003240 [Cryptotrichosporon argae]
MSATIKDEEKYAVEHIDEHEHGLKPLDTIDRHLAVDEHPALRGLSADELHAIERRATRKLDMLLMPILFVLYILNYLDRQNISSAKLANIMVDLDMTTQQYATAVAVLFAGYVALQVPSNMLASKIAYPGVYICVMCGFWGVVSGATGAVQSYAGLAVCRVILGFCEAAFFPGAIYLLSTFYTSKQLALRASALYSGSQVGNAFGGLFAIAILNLDGHHGLAGWRWLFIVEGAMTVGLATIFAFFIPNKPTTVRWLSEQERAALNQRLEKDRGTKDATDEVSIWAAARMAVTDPKTWLLCAVLQCNYIAASVTNFWPSVVSGLGFDRTTTLAITAPPYVLCCFTIILNGWHSDKKRERAFHIMVPFLVTIVANVIAISTTKIAPRYVAMMLLPGSFYASSCIILSWIGSSITGPHAKRAVAYALINALCNTPNIWTSYLYYDSPRYVAAFSVDLAAACLTIVFAFLTRLYLARQNRKLDSGEDTGKHGPTPVQIEAGFRYVL